MRRNLFLPRCIAVLVAVFCLGPNTAAAEALASPWSKGLHSRVRLTAATLLAQGNATKLYAGVDIRLDKNWKTYWQAPGDGGGIPPEFNWSKSRNVKSIQVMYPAPKLLEDKYGNSVGYKDEVLFPFAITPENPASPIELDLSVYYGVCEDICIPAQADLKLMVPPGARAAISIQRDLMKAISKVPGPTSKSVQISETKAVLTGPEPHLLVTTQAAAADAIASLFVATRDGEFLPIPKRIAHEADGRTMFKIDLKHLEDPMALASKTVDLTATIDKGQGVSRAWTINAEN